ncbi:ImmA/IrrE family metallo-endopeptidase [Novosphingobium sp.]|uniref:ImmA/IrrE family metallo-endopeptidase n=1 Tax=Novosphingobium sp. TaxID=1874826 RepID=UPI0038BCEA6C
MTWSKQSARDQAKAVLAEFGVESAPVPVERIIKRRNIKVQFSPLDKELSGMALIKDGISIIGVNALHHPNRQRFTMAHELGHHVMHHEAINGTVHVDKGFAMILMRDDLAAQGTDRMEIEANAFASELLMPASILEKLLDVGSVDLDETSTLEAIAKRFKVSLSALQYRLMAFK